jgi:hypothetical protein
MTPMADERENEHGRRTRLEGRLEGDSVTGLFRLLAEREATGVLRLERDERECSLYLEEGRIIFATSNDPNHRLGELLLRQGRIGFGELEQAVERLGRGQRLGTLLVEDGALSAQGLVQAVVDQVRDVVLGLIGWQRGRYDFDEGPLPTREVITLDLSTPELILQGIGQVEDWDRIRRAVGSPRSLLERGPALDEEAESIPELGATETAILEKLERPLTVDELCREVFASSFEVYRAVWALGCLDLVRPREREYPRPLPGEIPRQGRLESVGMSSLLLETCRAGETGVLRVWGPAGERSVHLKDGAVVFATSSDPNDSLVSYLLRRGVIGVRDRDEAARRLLSNKRIGTLLVERGSVTGAELEQYVREQVSEIVLGLFSWDGGEYAFEEGELPTLEEITLDSSVETLVLHGVLRVERWPWIVEGLGDLQGVYRLRPDYLDCLDRTEIGPGEWDMISLLKEERSLRELCQSSAFSDFQTARVVWGLLLIGVLERIPDEELREREEQRAREREEAEALAGAAALAVEAGEPGGDAEPGEAEEEPAPPREAEAVAEPAMEVEAEAEPVAEVGAETDEEILAEPEALEEIESLAGPAEAEEPEGDALAQAGELAVEEVLPPAEGAAGTEFPAGLEDDEDPFATVEEEDAEPVPVAVAEADGPFELEDLSSADRPARPVLAEELAPEAEEAAGEGPAFELGEPGESEELDEWPPEAPEGERPVDFELAAEGEERPEGPTLAEEVEAEGESEEAVPTLELDEPASGEDELAATMRLDRESLTPSDLPADEALEAVGEPVPSAAEAESGQDEHAAAEGGEETPEGDDLPQDHLDREIHRFNEKHRFLFDHLRAEIGAGARNFVSSCQRRAGDELSSMFEGCHLGPEGEYDAASLRRNIFDRNIDAYPHVFERLLHTEFDMVRDLLPPDRLERIESGLREIDDRYEP